MQFHNFLHSENIFFLVKSEGKFLKIFYSSQYGT